VAGRGGLSGIDVADNNERNVDLFTQEHSQHQEAVTEHTQLDTLAITPQESPIIHRSSPKDKDPRH
jgi:hypothetical protein